MVENNDEHERTLAFAETALNQIKALKLSAHPRNFEIWYTYATGHNPGLNQAINEFLAREARLTDQELEQIYDKHLSPVRFSERIDAVGGKIMGEIEQVMSMIDVAIGSASDYSESLASAAKDIAPDTDRDQLRLIVETLVRSTQEVEVTNATLQKRLVDSREEIRELQENLEVVRTESLTDPLTTLSNRKFLEVDRRGADQGHAAFGHPHRHRPFQDLQRHLRPSHRRPGRCGSSPLRSSKTSRGRTSPRAMAARNSPCSCRARSWSTA
jgi:diguanylate cyclase